MTVDVSDDKRAVSLIHALHAVVDAATKVQEASPTLDYSRPIREAGDELAWQLADRMGHKDVTGNAVTYRAGNVAVAVRIDQFVKSLRHVGREITWAAKTYGTYRDMLCKASD